MISTSFIGEKKLYRQQRTNFLKTGERISILLLETFLSKVSKIGFMGKKRHVYIKTTETSEAVVKNCYVTSTT